MIPATTTVPDMMMSTTTATATTAANDSAGIVDPTTTATVAVVTNAAEAPVDDDDDDPTIVRVIALRREMALRVMMQLEREQQQQASVVKNGIEEGAKKTGPPPAQAAAVRTKGGLAATTTATMRPTTIAPREGASFTGGAPHAVPSAKEPVPVVLAKPEKPDPSLTGVPFEILSICATLCMQIYYAKNLASFKLTNKEDASITAMAIRFDSTMIDVDPPLCVAVVGTCMILAWRGSQSIMDWVADFGAAPVLSSRWSRVSKHVRAHGAYTSFVESDLAFHEDYILKEIRSRKIDTLLLTGHSLAGGMAQVAHLMIEGQLGTKTSPWYPFRKSLTVRSLAFAAPMTTLVCAPSDVPMDDATRDLLTNIATRSCNLVYGPDVVPHGGGDVPYALAVAEALIPEIMEALITEEIDSLPVTLATKIFGVKRWVNKTLAEQLEKENVKKLTSAMVQYQHVGTILYYPAEGPGAEGGNIVPVPMRDCPFLPDSLPEFRGHPLIRVPTAEGRNATSVTDQIKVAHSFLLNAFAYNNKPDSSSTTAEA